ncbi:hypothetical protein PTSG_05740 [Salpingoeca rosetta]|uniref:Uncharacterized protein n=1 Tax=Salpingoeca rosetta (strain ATCC 50818 / BSB-021) TaxID=946362 RepID=F2UB34_SALR5|nr:uncharacterized protein PTSG_05740 [Salpingoeca rosetta]EGD74047.1 hypothetical protein PTSG_05740 [Salpingoeca rosetta]|eukprot:XP_004993609.1 hypothetical protein PTSG_05740 [Salpingoeca rosetta]
MSAERVSPPSSSSPADAAGMQRMLASKFQQYGKHECDTSSTDLTTEVSAAVPPEDDYDDDNDGGDKPAAPSAVHCSGGVAVFRTKSYSSSDITGVGIDDDDDAAEGGNGANARRNLGACVPAGVTSVNANTAPGYGRSVGAQDAAADDNDDDDKDTMRDMDATDDDADDDDDVDMDDYDEEEEEREHQAYMAQLRARIEANNERERRMLDDIHTVRDHIVATEQLLRFMHRK